MVVRMYIRDGQLGGGRSLSESAIEQRIDEFIDFLVNDPETGKARVDFDGKPFMTEQVQSNCPLHSCAARRKPRDCCTTNRRV